MKHKIKHFFQRRKRGFDDASLWNLDCTIAAFILPRLKRFQQINDGCPSNLKWKQWQARLSDMINAFELLSGDEFIYSDEQKRVVKHGLAMFVKYFESLWILP